MANAGNQPNVFGKDLDFLKKHTPTVVLSSSNGQARVVVAPAMQGRVMTSTANGDAGFSYGWINRGLITSGKTLPHINPYGGEDRFWLGPEGGQFSIFFKKDTPFDLDHWWTPAPMDTESFVLVEASSTYVHMRKAMHLVNYSETAFDLLVNREIRLLTREKAADLLGVALPESLRMVAFESNNQITNTGKAAWTKQGGLLSIWILGMFSPSRHATVVIPFAPGPESQLGPIVNDSYFGKPPADRLRATDKTIFFKADGLHRSKIGISPQRAKPVLGSYDAASKLLTIVQYTRPKGPADYVNSMWEYQQDPYAGDVVNSYNDGPATPGAACLGPFYELETSSPAAALQPEESFRHSHRTMHFEGAEAALDALAQSVLGVSLAEI